MTQIFCADLYPASTSGPWSHDMTQFIIIIMTNAMTLVGEYWGQDNVCKIIISRVDSEYQVFCATMNWVNHDISNRRRSVRRKIKYLGVKSDKLVYVSCLFGKIWSKPLHFIRFVLFPGLYFLSIYLHNIYIVYLQWKMNIYIQYS